MTVYFFLYRSSPNKVFSATVRQTNKAEQFKSQDDINAAAQSRKRCASLWTNIAMNTFFSDIFPKLQRFSQKLDNLTLLTDQHWVSIDNILSNKTVYIFRKNNELLISTNGKVEKAKWEYIDNKSLLIDKAEESYLFKHGFFDENILALKVDSSDEYAVFVNENKYNGDLNSINKVIDFLTKTYLDPTLKSQIENSTGHQFSNEQNMSIIKTSVDKEVNNQQNIYFFLVFCTIILLIFIYLATLYNK